MVAVRPTRADDLPAITKIYGHSVETARASFELTPPEQNEMAQRFEAREAKGFPQLTAEVDGVVTGFAYAAEYRLRPAYRFAVEGSIYVDPEHHGRGIGLALMTRLIEAAEALGYRQMIAVIGDSGNAGSIALHTRLGFRRVGTFQSIGWKHGVWVDSVLMQRPLGQADTTPPS